MTANSDGEYYNRRALHFCSFGRNILIEEHPGRTIKIKFKYYTYDKDGSPIEFDKYCDPGFDYTPGQN